MRVVAQGACSGLQVLHARGFVHRDVGARHIAWRDAGKAAVSLVDLTDSGPAGETPNPGINRRAFSRDAHLLDNQGRYTRESDMRMLGHALLGYGVALGHPMQALCQQLVDKQLSATRALEELARLG